MGEMDDYSMKSALDLMVIFFLSPRHKCASLFQSGLASSASDFSDDVRPVVKKCHRANVCMKNESRGREHYTST